MATTSPPQGWGADSLSAYLENMRDNQFATFANKSREFAVFREIDGCFLRITQNLVNPKNPVAALLLVRSHAAFRSASALAFSGDAVGAFAVARTSLEGAGYALHIHDNPALDRLWLNRHQSSDALRKVRENFSHGKIIKTIKSRDLRLGAVYEEIYQHLIDLGAHPNQGAVTGNMHMERQRDHISIKQIYLHEDGLQLAHALKTVIEVGIGALHIFQFVFTDRFALLGLRDRIKALGASYKNAFDGPITSSK